MLTSKLELITSISLPFYLASRYFLSQMSAVVHFHEIIQVLETALLKPGRFRASLLDPSDSLQRVLTLSPQIKLRSFIFVNKK